MGKEMMTSYAYYRLPRAKSYTRIVQHKGEPEQIRSVESLNGRRGFVVAPFAITDGCPLLLIQPDEVTVGEMGEAMPSADVPSMDEKAETSPVVPHRLFKLLCPFAIGRVSQAGAGAPRGVALTDSC